MWTSSSSHYAGGQTPGAAWEQEAAGAGRRGTHRIVEAGMAPAPMQVASLLGVPSGSPVVVRRRTVHLDDVPVELTDSYLLADVAADTALALPAKVKGGVAGVLRERGIETRPAVEEVESRPPTASEQKALDLADGVWVLVVHRTYATDADEPIWVDVMVASALHQRLRYEMRTG
ncbi:UTRA domain-containing protein [Kitasatospora sp. NPDC048545]|uniref:UTRA domain-containing protein n=1 Tax=Kitasatospora sp. NPDC048545 TaxID=3157208 RepID=UPI0033EE45E6